MYFKKLELNGFKSFADKTILKFEPGITAIVGPNGCGKSNIADALRWVLGEQGTKDLRVHRSEDLIFNGSISRKPEGYAQVSITIENNGSESRSPRATDKEESAPVMPQPDNRRVAVETGNGGGNGTSAVVDGNGNGNPSPETTAAITEEHPVFDGTSAVVDLEQLSEVTVSRRHYRSGDSEYFINKEAVRLKDITNLFLDTGLGGNAYSVIERDRIDLILNGKPEDRRFLFEEAAGIMKYRHRKIEAMRKLEDTQTNILRISDIVSEVKRSINAIRRQVSKAERYKRHYAELKDLEVKLNLHKLHRIVQDWDALKGKLDSARKEDEKFKQSLSSIEDRIEELRRELQDKEDKLRNQKDRHYEIISSRERAASQISLLGERKSHLGQRKDEIRKEIGRMEERLSSIDSTIAGIEDDIKEINSKIEHGKALLAQKEEERKKVELHLEETQRLEKDYLCLCCTVCNYRTERDKDGCFLNGKRFEGIKNTVLSGSQNKDLAKPVLTIQQEIEDFENKKEGLRRETEGIKIEIVSLEGKLEAMREFVASNSRGREETVQRKDSLNKEIDELPVRLKNMEEEILSSRQEFDTLSKEIEKDKEVMSKYEEERRKVRDILMEEEGNLREMRRSRIDDDTKLRELEIKEIEFKMQSENIIQKLRQEYNFEISDDLSALPALPDGFNPEEAENQARDLREKIEKIGQVNLVATQEYQRLKERYLFLRGQSGDLTKSEENLKKLIEEVEKICKIRFTETFGKIKENFESIYKQLFDGGEACLSLSNPDDPLETGIEITAQPPGKKLQSIFLLSAGEQTMTAIALLFSIFLVKPSPFCLLDEIDAPLDDSNILRFTKLLKEFSRASQFIVITHNKRTMEAANILYGITMEENGVSKLVSVKMGEPVPV